MVIRNGKLFNHMTNLFNSTNEVERIDKAFVAHLRKSDGEIQSLWQHLLGTSALAGQFAAKIGLENVGKIAGLLHDFGKASQEFLTYISSANCLIEPGEDEYIDPIAKKGKIDHSTAGAQFIWKFGEKSKDAILMNQILSLIIASHHSGLINCLDSNGVDNFSIRMNKPDEKTHLSEAKENLKEVYDVINEISSYSRLLQDFNQKIDLLKEENDSKQTWMFKIGLLVRFLFSALIDADRIDAADFEYPQKRLERNLGKYESWTNLIQRFDSYLNQVERNSIEKNNESKEINTVRRNVSRYCFEFSSKPKGLYKLTVPTGGGKTLSSLRFALNHANLHNMDRVIYIIPYTSIIDQNAGKAREALDHKIVDGTTTKSIVLEHHSNLTPDKESPLQYLLSENWDSRIVFSTMVKFLETLFGSGTRDTRRLHNLANSVIVFDEVQTLPIECVHMFNLAIRFLVRTCGSTVVLCTATQPLLDKIAPRERSLIIKPEQEIIPISSNLFNQSKRVEFYNKCKVGGWSTGEISEFAMQELHITNSVLIIVNTTGEARDLFRQFAGREKDLVYHLSTNMCPAHRVDTLNQIKKKLENNEPVICISTQLIEAGIDIDFASVIRYLAGIDSIAQAAGRCNRNGIRPIPGRLYVVNPRDENLDQLKSIRIGKNIAERVLKEFGDNPEKFNNDLFGPEATELYYQYFFYGREKDMCYPVKRDSVVGREDNLFNILSTNTLSLGSYQRVNKSPPSLKLMQSFMTAASAFKVIVSKKRGVIVPYEAGESIIISLTGSKNIGREYTLLRDAQRYSVELFEHQFSKLERLGIIQEVQKGSGVFYLGKSYYNISYGISETESDGMPFLNP